MFFKRIKKGVTLLVAVSFIAAMLLMPTTISYANYGDNLLYWGVRGDDVRQVQQDLTKLGYDTYGIDGIFGPRTYNAVVSFQKTNGLVVDGLVGQATKKMLEQKISSQSLVYTVQKDDSLWLLANQYKTTITAIKAANGLTSDIIYIGQKLVIPSAQPSNPPPNRGQRFGQLLPWEQVNGIFTTGMKATVTDLETGLTWQVKRRGGSYHADCEPVTANDAANMKKAYGGEWSWGRRAIIVSVAGYRIAASQNGMPHGGQSIYDNNFPGHFCIHFLNSMIHGNNQYASGPPHVDAAHQAAVKRAAGL